MSKNFEYYDIIDNDVVNGENICVSLWVGGCPLRCPNCHNQNLWDKQNDKTISEEVLDFLLNNNNIKRNLSILGGEPLSENNVNNTNFICSWFKEKYPDRKLFLWTGYTIEELKEKDDVYQKCFKYADYIIDGRYEQDKRDIRFHLRGSANQRILKKNIDF